MTPASSEAPAGSDRVPAASYDGLEAGVLRGRLQLTGLVVYDVVGSTMDVAHSLADAGAPGGTAVLADTQFAGRGRQGRAWRSASGQGVWITFVERPRDADGVEVLSLRTGLALAEALEPLAMSPVRLKWPNDVFVDAGKLAGILIEARWRDRRLEWLAIGIGLNVRPPAGGAAGSLRDGVSRLEALERVVAAVRAASAMTGALTDEEVARFHARDLAVGRTVVAPSQGVVAGIDRTGGISIVGAGGAQLHRAGSLVFAEDA